MTDYSITLNIHLCYIKFFTKATFCIKKKLRRKSLLIYIVTPIVVLAAEISNIFGTYISQQLR